MATQEVSEKTVGKCLKNHLLWLEKPDHSVPESKLKGVREVAFHGNGRLVI